MPSLIVGVAGGSGSGKSTVARKVAEQLTGISVASVSMDAYYRNGLLCIGMRAYAHSAT